jgi:polar amino acid transport system permease protein
VLGTTPLTRELTSFARSESSKGFNGTPLVVAGLLYLATTIPLTRYVAYLERKTQSAR